MGVLLLQLLHVLPPGFKGEEYVFLLLRCSWVHQFAHPFAEREVAGLRKPLMKGPINSPSVSDLISPMAILAESRLGITSTFALPCRLACA